MRVCLSVCLSVRSQTPLSSRHESGPSLFLSTGKHPVGGQLPRVFFSALPGQSSDRPNLPPHKKLSIFQLPFAQYSESNLRSMQCTREAKKSIVQRPNGQVRSFRGPPSRPSFSTGPWSLCIVTGHDRLMTVTSRPENNACAYCMPVDLLPVLAVDLLVQQATACGLPEVFHVSPRDRSRSIARVDPPVVRAICQRSIGSVFDCKQTTSHGLVLRVYASQ